MGRSMRLVTTLLIACALVSSTLGAGLLHVHEAFEHAHGAHHLGVAAHSHLRVQRPSNEIRLAPCDPATHLKLLSFTTVQTAPAVAAALPERVRVNPEPETRSEVPRFFDEPRAHGPPLTPVGQRPPPFLPAV